MKSVSSKSIEKEGGRPPRAGVSQTQGQDRKCLLALQCYERKALKKGDRGISAKRLF